MRIARPLAVTAAALTLAVGVPLATGSTSAWAVCGATPTPHPAPAAKHQGTLEVKALKTLPTTITAGGAQVEVPVRITNRTDAPYQQVEPQFSVGHYYDMKADVAVEQVAVEWRQGKGPWKKLGLQLGCTRGLVNQDVLPRLALKQGESAELSFRFSLVAAVPKALDTVSYTVFAQGEDLNAGSVGATLRVTPASAPKSTPTAKPSAAAPVAKAAAAEAPKSAPSTSPSASATTVQQDVAATELASTGPRTPNTFLVLSALGAIALGAGVLAAVRWSRSH
ncbi:hypothetical protein ACWCYY_33590 [Kitasatospora sp. NPDC001664]